MYYSDLCCARKMDCALMPRQHAWSASVSHMHDCLSILDKQICQVWINRYAVMSPTSDQYGFYAFPASLANYHKAVRNAALAHFVAFTCHALACHVEEKRFCLVHSSAVQVCTALYICRRACPRRVSSSNIACDLSGDNLCRPATSICIHIRCGKRQPQVCICTCRCRTLAF